MTVKEILTEFKKRYNKLHTIFETEYYKGNDTYYAQKFRSDVRERHTIRMLRGNRDNSSHSKSSKTKYQT
jgi:hypothetical protein